MNYLFALLLTVVSSPLFAETIFPKGCHAIAVNKDIALLPTKNTALFLIQNTTSHDLWLTHTKKNPGAGAGWTSKVGAGNWSALNVAKDFTLNCIESKPGHEQQIACSDAIKICKYTKVTFPEGSDGSYWAGEDLSLAALKAHLENRGIILNPQ